MGQNQSCMPSELITAIECEQLDMPFTDRSVKYGPVSSINDLPNLHDASSADEDEDFDDDNFYHREGSVLEYKEDHATNINTNKFCLNFGYSNLYTFSFSKKIFHYAQTRFGKIQWCQNDLVQAVLINISDKSSIYKWLHLNDTSSPQFNYTSISRSSLLLVGSDSLYNNCVEYNFRTNTFFGKSFLPKVVRLPNLCCFEGKVYSTSGVEDHGLSHYFAEYSILEDSWTEKPLMPLPHMLGSSICYTNCKSNARSKHQDHKIFVIGGLKAVTPKVFNISLSIYSTLTGKWEVFDLKESKIKTPSLVRPILLNRSKEKFLIVGCDGQRSVYELDVAEGKVEEKASLPCSQDYHQWGNSTEATQIDGDLIILSRRPSGHDYSDFEKTSVLRYSVKEETWSSYDQYLLCHR